MWVQDFDDDGESAAGGRLLHLLQMTNAVNVVVVRARECGNGSMSGLRRCATRNMYKSHTFGITMATSSTKVITS